MNLLLICFFYISFLKPAILSSPWTNEEESTPASIKFSLDNRKKFEEEGRRNYELMKAKRNFYGLCWQTAFDALHQACDQLDEEVQSRLALSFANCFLAKAGMRTFPCDSAVRVADCIKHSDDRAFNAYTEFFTHTQSVCFFLQNQKWQNETEETINRLSVATKRATDILEVAFDSLNRLQQLQNRSISAQLRLYEEIVESRRAIREYEESNKENRFIVKEILDRFIKLQDFVLFEISYAYSIAFFICSVVIIYFFTTTTRTADARFWLFAILVLEFFIEMFLITYGISDEHILINGMKNTSMVVNERIRMVRKAAWLLISFTLLWFAWTYQDFNRVNNQLLQDIKRQLDVHLVYGSRKRKSILDKKQKSKLFSDDEETDSDFSSGHSDSESNETGSSADSDVSEETRSMTPAVSSACNGKTVSDSTPDERAQVKSSCAASRYDLRPRNSQSPMRPVVSESVQDFIRRVKVSAQISKLNRKENRTLNNDKVITSFYSSDEN